MDEASFEYKITLTKGKALRAMLIPIMMLHLHLIFGFLKKQKECVLIWANLNWQILVKAIGSWFIDNFATNKWKVFKNVSFYSQLTFYLEVFYLKWQPFENLLNLLQLIPCGITLWLWCDKSTSFHTVVILSEMLQFSWRGLSEKL